MLVFEYMNGNIQDAQLDWHFGHVHKKIDALKFVMDLDKQIEMITLSQYTMGSRYPN